MPERLELTETSFARSAAVAPVLRHGAVGVERLKFGPGEYLVRKGEENPYLYLLEQGDVFVTLDDLEGSILTQRGEPGSEKLVWFGEIASELAQDSPNASIVAKTEVIALRFDTDSISVLFHCFPRVAEDLFNSVVAKLRRVLRKLSGIPSIAERSP